MTTFNGREFAREKETELKKEVADLKKRGITPKLVSILVGDNPGSILYTSLKKKAAEKIGAEVEILRYKDIKGIREEIGKLNKDKGVHGIMIQLPLPNSLRRKTKDLIDEIIPEKDVDGLRIGSPYIPATVRAVLQIIKVAKKETRHDFKNIVVIGASGMVGKPLAIELKKLRFRVIACDVKTKNLKLKTKKADLLISATGVPNLVKKDMVKNGVVVIDIGSPKGDVEFNEVVKMASFITPVPGGVGPVTIVSLLDNLLIATRNSI